MSFNELPEEERRALFADLQAIYDGFEAHARTLPSPRGSCAGCGLCCVGPPFYMACSDLEYEYALDYARKRGLGGMVRFDETSPDKRRMYRRFHCPFYSEAEGCTVYPQRPFACRVFGRYARQRIPFDACGFQDVSVPFEEMSEVPFHEAYMALLKRYPAHRGYVVPTSMSYPRPTVNLLLDLDMPRTPMRNVRLEIEGPDSPILPGAT